MGFYPLLTLFPFGNFVITAFLWLSRSTRYKNVNKYLHHYFVYPYSSVRT